METTHNAKDCPEKKEVSCSMCNKKGHIAMFHGRTWLNQANGQTDRLRRGGNDTNLKIVDPPKTAPLNAGAAGNNAATKQTDEEVENPPI